MHENWFGIRGLASSAFFLLIRLLQAKFDLAPSVQGAAGVVCVRKSVHACMRGRFVMGVKVTQSRSEQEPDA